MNSVENGMRLAFVLAGVFCLYVAGHLAVKTRVEVHRHGPEPSAGTVTTRREPHPANWGAAEGFAIAGGLCFLAAGLVQRSVTVPVLERPVEDELPSPFQQSRLRGRRIDR
jgi:hypothetical protein